MASKQKATEEVQQESQTEKKVIESINDFSIKEIAKKVLTNFNGKHTEPSKSSWYFTYCDNYTIRISDHLAKNSDGNIQVVQIDDEHILFWKIGVRQNSVDAKNEEINGFSKLITKEELFDILTVINNTAKYFVP